MSAHTKETQPAAPVITRSQAVWRGAQLFDAGPAGRTHMIDADSKQAPGPVETLLNAVATCASVDVIDILDKRRTPVEALTVNMTAERRPDFPRRVMRLELEFRIDGAGIEREHAERAIHLSFEKYCSVGGSLGADIQVTARLTLNGESFAGFPLAVWSPSR